MAWADTAKTARFLWVVDARVAPLYLLLGVHFRAWSLYLAAGVTLILWAIEYFLGISVTVFLKRIRHRLAGRRRSARPWWYWKRHKTTFI